MAAFSPSPLHTPAPSDHHQLTHLPPFYHCYIHWAQIMKYVVVVCEPGDGGRSYDSCQTRLPPHTHTHALISRVAVLCLGLAKGSASLAWVCC